ncbi:beta-mannosidase-like [Cochliomyia hominivorax]
MELNKFIKIYDIIYAVIFIISLPHKSIMDSVNYVNFNKNWTLTNQNHSITRTGITVPSGVYSILYGEQVLDAYNDVNLRWIAYDNWTYTNTFTMNPSDLKTPRFVNLTFHGVDTVAEIRLNHYLLGRTDNMFVRYSYDVTSILRAENFLEVEIKSPIYAALQKAKAFKEQNITIPPNCPNQRYDGECHMNMLRKMQASFSWDWGLAAPSMGLWKSVVMEIHDVAILRDVDVALRRNETHWNMDVRVFIDCSGQKDFEAELTFYPVELLQKAIVINNVVSYKAPMIMFDLAIPKEQITLWWPNGFGDQKLYPLHFTLKAWWNKANATLRDKIISQKSIRIGFRTIELVEEPVNEGNGNTFLFKVNGQEIFMKGSNYIPSHILPELNSDKTRIKHLLQSARDTHQNMIRIWGGGIYESDEFYDMADAMGILIWQDMMFACAMYPATEEFLASVRQEVIQNAKRIGHHASIAIFATNNENEVALAQNWYQTAVQQEKYKADYRQLYLATVIHELKILEYPSRPRPLVSSPSNGKESEKDNYISSNPQDPNYGDIHFYDIFQDGWNPRIYPKPRFASEYGFQSLPSMSSWLKTLNDTKRLEALINHRQHHPLGMLAITGLVRRHFPLPLPEDPDYIEALIYLSQISQAMATKIETEVYRSLRDTEHRTMGALYWQLNDVWVAPSWSAIDFYGNYKLLHYWSKEFLAPIAIVALYDSDSKHIQVSLICDKFEVDTTGLQVTMNIYKWSELFPRETLKWPATLKPNGVHYDKIIPIDDIIKDPFNKNNCFLEFILQQNSEPLARTFYFPGLFTEVVKDPGLELKISHTNLCKNTQSLKTNSYSLTLTTKYPAVFVYLDLIQDQYNVTKYSFSHNGFMLISPIMTIFLEIESTQCIEKLNKNDIKIFTVNQYV